MREALSVLLLAFAVSGQEPVTLPEIAIKPLPEKGKLSVFRPAFEKYATVFDVLVVATGDTADRKVLHATHVLAQYLDNDEDGKPDDPKVAKNLRERGAFLAMAARERDFRRLRIRWEKLERAGFELGQDLYGEETLPEGPPHVRRRGRFDAALEEVLHLVSHGYEEVYPAAFRFGTGSELAKAMDLARGGRFRRVPRRYPEKAWYHYDDETCDYGCQCAEYFYWALTSILGGQDYPGRAEEIEEEWELPTRKLVSERDPAVFKLLTDARYLLPTVLPNGRYGSRQSGKEVGPPGEVRFSPDMELVKPRSRREHRRLGGRAPYFVLYRKDGRELVFVAARHEPRMGSSTHNLIEAIIKGFKPEYIVVEGVGTDQGPSPAGPLRAANRLRERGDCPEPLFAMALAADRDIPFIGGEPSASVTTAALRSLGDDRDALGFLVVRDLGQLQREDGPGALDSKVQQLLPRLRKRFGLDTKMDLDDFKAWFLERTERPFEPKNLRRDQVAPLAGRDPSFLRRMGIAVMLARERHLVALEARLLEKHRRVMVIYGSGHLVYERAVLDKMLGKPVRTSRSW